MEVFKNCPQYRRVLRQGSSPSALKKHGSTNDSTRGQEQPKYPATRVEDSQRAVTLQWKYMIRVACHVQEYNAVNTPCSAILSYTAILPSGDKMVPSLWKTKPTNIPGSVISFPHFHSTEAQVCGYGLTILNLSHLGS